MENGKSSKSNCGKSCGRGKRTIMRILFVMSRQQQNASIMCALDRMGHEVGQYPAAVESIGGSGSGETAQKQFRTFLENSGIDFVISNVFGFGVAQTTHELGIKYAVYGMDSPMYETYLPVFPRYDNCYLFFCDKKEWRMAGQQGYTNVYYLPLAADVAWAGNLVITEEEIKKYSCDMSFVGVIQ